MVTFKGTGNIVQAIAPLLYCSVVLWLAVTLQAGESRGRLPALPLSQLPRGLSSFMPVPPDNPLTAEKIELGRRLFFDNSLSRDGTVACASCHQPDKGFTDGRALPVGIDRRQGRRNVPTLLNCAYGLSMFWDGRAATLEEQALVPLANPSEMGNSLKEVVKRLQRETRYRRLFHAAFSSSEVTPLRIAQALASFQRTLVAGDSAYDRSVRSRDETVLNETARRGMKLFFGKARCAHCHEGELFTDQKFHNTGVSWGKLPGDLGRYEPSRHEEDRGKFKTPTLRNLLLTAPYMHDGSLATLEEVVEFYNRGGERNPYLDQSIQPLTLSQQDQSDLIEYLKTLTSPARSSAFATSSHQAVMRVP